MYPLSGYIPCYTFTECKDTYPREYWNKCSVGCEWIKQKNKCAKRWKDVFPLTMPRCKNAIENIKQFRVDRYCRKTCQICGGSIFKTFTVYLISHFRFHYTY